MTHPVIEGGGYMDIEMDIEKDGSVDSMRRPTEFSEPSGPDPAEVNRVLHNPAYSNKKFTPKATETAPPAEKPVLTLRDFLATSDDAE